MPVDAVSNYTVATLKKSRGTIRTFVEVGQTGAKAGDLALDHKFDANASSVVASQYAVNAHCITLELRQYRTMTA